MTVFITLPAEIQRKIWEFSWEPRTVPVELTSESSIVTRAQLPASLHVHRASRGITCRSYSHNIAALIDHKNSAGNPRDCFFYFKADLDILFVHGPAHPMYLKPEYLARLLSFVPIQHVRLSDSLTLLSKSLPDEEIVAQQTPFYDFLEVIIESPTMRTVTFRRESLHSTNLSAVRLVRYDVKEACPCALVIARPPIEHPDTWRPNSRSLYPWQFLPDPGSNLRRDGAIIFASSGLIVAEWRLLFIVPGPSHLPRELIWFLAIFHQWFESLRSEPLHTQEQPSRPQHLQRFQDWLRRLPFIIDGVCAKDFARTNGGTGDICDDDNFGAGLNDLCDLMEHQVDKWWPKAISPRQRAYRDAVKEGIMLDMKTLGDGKIPLTESNLSQGSLIRWSGLLQRWRDGLTANTQSCSG